MQDIRHLRQILILTCAFQISGLSCRANSSENMGVTQGNNKTTCTKNIIS